MVEGLFLLKTRGRKKIAHLDLSRRFVAFALSLGLVFTGSSGVINAQGERRDQRCEPKKRRPEKVREAYKRRPEKEGEARKRRPEKEQEARKRDAELQSEPRKRYEETRRETVKRKRGWVKDDDAKQSLFLRQPEKRERERFSILPKDAKQSLFLRRPEDFKRRREWIREARKLRQN